jgi:hypothetical protein
VAHLVRRGERGEALRALDAPGAERRARRDERARLRVERHRARRVGRARVRRRFRRRGLEVRDALVELRDLRGGGGLVGVELDDALVEALDVAPRLFEVRCRLRLDTLDEELLVVEDLRGSGDLALERRDERRLRGALRRERLGAAARLLEVVLLLVLELGRLIDSMKMERESKGWMGGNGMGVREEAQQAARAARVGKDAQVELGGRVRPTEGLRRTTSNRASAQPSAYDTLPRKSPLAFITSRAQEGISARDGRRPRAPQLFRFSPRSDGVMARNRRENRWQARPPRGSQRSAATNQLKIKLQTRRTCAYLERMTSKASPISTGYSAGGSAEERSAEVVRLPAGVAEPPVSAVGRGAAACAPRPLARGVKEEAAPPPAPSGKEPAPRVKTPPALADSATAAFFIISFSIVRS